MVSTGFDIGIYRQHIRNLEEMSTKLIEASNIVINKPNENNLKNLSGIISKMEKVMERKDGETRVLEGFKSYK